MMMKDWPFLLRHRQAIALCLSGASCAGLANTMNGLGPRVGEVSAHPPHLIDSMGAPTPAALIPFCGYKSSMTALGEARAGLPVCTGFQPTVLDGQLCYSLNISALQAEMESKIGKKNGLLLLLDPGESEQYREGATQTSEDTFWNIDLEAVHDNDRTARVHLATLASHSVHQAGTYTLSSLKWIAGTAGFLSMPDPTKACRHEPRELCQMREYLAAVRENCDCVPFVLGSVLEPEWTSPSMPFCTPNTTSCTALAASVSSSGCLVPCTGLYADLLRAPDPVPNYGGTETVQEGRDGHKLERLMEEYVKYKEDFAQNIRFDPELDNLGKDSTYMHFFLNWSTFSDKHGVSTASVGPDLF
jgi:hypothetical protein